MLEKRVKKIILLSAVALLLLVAAVCVILRITAVFTAEPVIVTDGDKATVEVFSDYKLPDAEAYVSIWGKKQTLDVEQSGSVDSDTLGNYTLTYSATYRNKTVTKDFTVAVCDTTAPVISTDVYNYEVEYSGKPVTESQIKVKATAFDAYDGDLTESITKTVDGNICYLRVSDASGNTAEHEINIIVNDGVYSTIVMKGPSTVYLAAGSDYNELGYTATDNKDGNITSSVKVSGSIDTTTSGTYFKEYKVTDGAGNTSKVVRRVIVYGTAKGEDYKDVPKNGKTVYLTFDDGPSAYTKTLLDCLDQYGVKATFFVTNQFSGYKNLIGDAYSRGHKIAIHTYSHQIYKQSGNIYAGVESYLKDFMAMQAIVEEQTGSTTNIFRFPGGTNNLISKNYCKGIMTALAKEMTDAGYVYFDWNVDSYDSRTSSTTQDIIDHTISQISTKKNAVVLMHDIHKKTVNAVPAVIEYCLQNGYTFKVLEADSPACRFKPAN